jgi:hypothetical protein
VDVGMNVGVAVGGFCGGVTIDATGVAVGVLHPTANQMNRMFPRIDWNTFPLLILSPSLADSSRAAQIA